MRRKLLSTWDEALLALIPVVILASAGPVFAQESPATSRRPSSKVGGIATAEAPDFTRFRVVTDEGVLVVFDADEEWDGRSEPASQLAYWHDFATEQLFFFDQLLFTPDDVLQSMATMQRDLNIDPAPILVEKPEFAPLPEITSPGLWRPAMEVDVLTVMGGGVAGSADDGGVSGVIQPCDPGSCPEPQSATSPLPGPVRGTPREQLFAQAQSGSGCVCGGGDTCGYCNDGYYCTIDRCDGNGGCTHRNRNCDDGDICTGDWCEESMDRCRNDRYGSSSGATCCPAPPDGFLICPAATPKCCIDTLHPSWDHCCFADQTCCAWACCDSDETCCGGQCYSGLCEAGECVDDEWIFDPPCDDHNPCTDDYCIDDVCTYIPNYDPCLGDGDSCTQDVCNEGSCTHPPGNNGSSCADDGDVCTDDYCQNGACTHPPICGALTCCVPGAQAHVASGQGGPICCDDTCEACVYNGDLSGGTLTVQPDPVCVGETITWTASGVSDSGGGKRVDCNSKQDIPPDGIAYKWTLSLPANYPNPPPLTGSGSSASVLAKVPGVYSCAFTAEADRDCPPPPLNIEESVEALGTKIPLGMSLVSTGGPDCYRVFMPTKWGGKLDVQTTAGIITDLAFPDGSPYTNNTETGEDKHGWYTFKVYGAISYTVSTNFVQVGEAAATPWNGWYWPSLDTVNPNLYDQTGAFIPLKDFDTVYGTTERATEEANYAGGDAWWGHCWGWSLAAIAKSQPTGTTAGGVSFNQDEMEGLYTELAEGATAGWTWRVGSPSSKIPAGPPTASLGEPIDAWADDVKNGLRQYVRQQSKAMNGDLRDAGGAEPSEVWNHDVYKYTSAMMEAPGGNEKIIEITTAITANRDTAAMPADGATRTDTYVFVLEYKGDGTIDGASPSQNWKSCSAFAPACLGTVETLNWQGEHCGITKAQVDRLYP